MREAQFWGQIRKRLPHSVFARRIEDSSGNLGTFDTFVARNRAAAWMELKVAGPNAKPDLRPGQAAFAAQCFDAGIPAAYLVGSPDGTVRMIGPWTTGDDWRDHLVARWDGIDVPAIIDELFGNGDLRHGREPQSIAIDPLYLRAPAREARPSPACQVQGASLGG